MEYDEFSAMNSVVLSAAEGKPGDLAPGFEEVRNFVQDCEIHFSRFQKDSELSKLNRSAGSWFQCSLLLYELIQEALESYTLTRGLFDPSILAALIRSGYDRSIDDIRMSGPQPMVKIPFVQHTPFDETRLDPDENAVFLPEGVQIDLGGIAKGWIAERAVRILEGYSSICAVSAGGDIALAGIPAGSSAWQISLEDPRDPNQKLAVLNVNPGTVATSSVTKRTWKVGEQSKHHIIDPKNGLPSNSTWLSMTVYASKATHAEAFAKALLISEEKDISFLTAGMPGLRWIAVRQDGTLWGSAESMEMIYVH